MTRYFTNSEHQTWKRCRRKWWFVYYRRLRRKQLDLVGVRKIGSRLHEALRAYYSPTPMDPFLVLHNGFLQDAHVLPIGDVSVADRFHKDRELATIMLEGYVQWLQETGADQGLSIIAAEQKLEVQSPWVDVKLMGKLDLRVTREIDNARLFLDHKTVGSFGQATSTLHMDEQMMFYHLLEFLKALEEGVPEQVSDGALYNMLRRVKRTGTAKPPFYERIEVRHNKHELRSLFVRVHGAITAVLDAEARLLRGDDPNYVAFPSPTRNCSWDCDFFDACPMVDDGSDVEGFLNAYFEEADPYEHYEQEGEFDLD